MNKTPRPALLLSDTEQYALVSLLKAGNAALALDLLCTQIDQARKNWEDHEQTVEAARSNYCYSSDDHIEIDDMPPLSVAETGVWVGAWVWVNIMECEPTAQEDAEPVGEEEFSPTKQPADIIDVICAKMEARDK